MANNIGWIILAFVIYFGVMIGIGFLSMSKNNSSEEYFLGGRSLNGFVAALSAQASDMSGWLLMGLPGSVYALGTGQIWIAIGLFIGTVCNWLFISTRLRRYTIVADNAVTLPQYFGNRFKEGRRFLLLVSAVAILIFFLVYTASAFSAGGQLFATVFGIDYHIALIIGACVIVVYTLLGGFKAVCDTDFVQGTVMLIALIAVPIIAYGMIHGNVAGNVPQGIHFLDPLYDGGKPISAVSIISQLGWGLGYCGMPHILVRFMAVKNNKELNKAKVVGISWVAASLLFAVFIGIIGRSYLKTDLAAAGSQEKVFLNMIIDIFTKDFNLPIIAGIFLCGALAAIMSTADSQLLVTGSCVTEDIYQGFMKRRPSDKKAVWISRVVVLIIAGLALFIAWNPNNSIMGLVSDAWAGLGSAFGPTVLLSLYWKRINTKGAIAGIAVGATTVLIWDYIPLVGGQTLYAATGLYSLIVGFGLSTLAILIFSLATKAPSQEVLDEFERVRSKEEI
ncbi:MAG: sodium/proline symporter PutP [Clostridiales bacterium]|nr:sodium/proline symporter PutP [Clostridiales bacterium]MBS5877668.1 sodium/proline symporter PutP [Clostridiales bacterium]MDU0939444.1 sodium/proline symporter PutP [Clostridiales bacterium]MDU1041976.1 sodium/proline symporter PutP [Clostridiales bacterium]MDU3490609.1 sodium/proline symporter PutP [Clostridiales bacterium]